MAKKKIDTKATSNQYQVTNKDNGSIEIILNIPANLIEQTRDEVVKEFASEVTIPGFRKGMAPFSKVAPTLNKAKVDEHILSHILPKMFADAVEKEKIRPAMYPRFEAMSMQDGQDWKIMAIVCELPKITLGEYKKKLKGKNTNEILEELPNVIKFKIPQILVDEEVNGRLGQLLERINKLGLEIESYLKSVGKTVESLKAEYQEQAQKAIAIEMILNEIANQEKVEVSEDEINQYIKATGADLKQVNPENKNMLARIIMRRKALEIITPKVKK